MLTQTFRGTAYIRKDQPRAILKKSKLTHIRFAYILECDILHAEIMDNHFGMISTHELYTIIPKLTGKTLELVYVPGIERPLQTVIIKSAWNSKDNSAKLILAFDAQNYLADNMFLKLSEYSVEARISLSYEKPICSICGKYIIGCPHWSGEKYDEKGICYYYYEGLTEKLEELEEPEEVKDLQ